MKRLRFCLALPGLALILARVLAAEEVRVAAPPRHSLWQIEGRSNMVYVLGSIHLLKAADYPLPGPIEAAFSNAPIIAFETDIAQMMQPETQLKIMAQGTLPPGRTLKDELSPALYASFSNHVTADGLPLALFDRFKPVLAAMTLGVIELQSLGVDPEHGVDQYFFNRARKEGKQILSLETVDFQIGLVTGGTGPENEFIVKATLENLDQTRSAYQEMVTAWQTGDVVRLEKLVNEALRESPAVFRRLVTDRSRNWASRVEDLLRGDRDALVIVGAGHVIGKEGLVGLLRNRGWKVRQL